jgi:hypothetical protein
MTTTRIDFTLITRAARLAARWHRSEYGMLRHVGPMNFDLEVIPGPYGADLISIPYQQPGPRTRIASWS